MHDFWFFFLRKREFSALLILALIAAGTYSLFAIPKESSPEVVVPIGIVTTVYPGASARDIEELITNKLEREIANVDDLDTLTSNSRDGSSVIVAEFDARADIDKSIQNLKDAVDAAKGELPDDANDPFISKVDFVNQPIVVLSVSAKLPPTEFTKLAEEVVDELESVKGVSDVFIDGARPHEVQVIVKEASLAAYDLTLQDVTRALGAANLTFPVGTVVTGDIEYAVRFEGTLTEINDIKNIPIRVFGSTPVYIRDVAQVTYGVERQTSISRVSVDGKPAETAFNLSVFKQSGVDVTEMSEAVIKKVDELKSDGELLSSSQVLVVYDQGEYVKKRLDRTCNHRS